MRKILFIILTVMMVIIMGVVVANGISFANVSGVKQISQKNEEIKKKNEELTNKVEVEYPGKIKEVEDAEQQLKTKKEEYESQIALNADSGTGYLATLEKYEIEYLWTRLGNHAKDNEVDIKIDLTNSNTAGLYKLNFEVYGSYVSVTDYIYAIENDSKLGFKIDNFVATPNTTTITADKNSKVAEIKATFSCDEIGINIQNLDKQTTETTDTTNTNATNTTNSSNTTNTNSTTNNTAIDNTTSTNNTTSQNSTKNNTSTGNTNTTQTATDTTVVQ